jgi:hypothetical protein
MIESEVRQENPFCQCGVLRKNRKNELDELNPRPLNLDMGARAGRIGYGCGGMLAKTETNPLRRNIVQHDRNQHCCSNR